MPSPDHTPRTAWFAWFMHLLLGLVIGGGMGLVVAALFLQGPWMLGRLRSYYRFDLIEYHQLGEVVLGVALIVGAITSYRGNRVWFTPSLWDAPQPHRGRLAGALSITLGIVGVITVLRAVLLHLAQQPPPTHAALTSPLLIPLLAVGSLILFTLVYALREDKLPWLGSKTDRDDAPLTFWMILTCLAISFVSILLQFFL